MNRTCRDNGYKPKQSQPKSTGSGGKGSDPQTNSILQSTSRNLQLDCLNYVSNSLSVHDQDDENRSPKRKYISFDKKSP